MGLQGSRVQIPPSRWARSRPHLVGFVTCGLRSALTTTSSRCTMRSASVALFAVILVACGGGEPKGDTAGGEMAAELGIDPANLTKTASGLQYQDVTPGTGAEATPGQVALVHYTGWLTDGTKFDSSR